MRKGLSSKNWLLVLLVMSLFAGLSCTAVTQTPAPSPSPPVTQPPERAPDIQSITARIIMEGNMLTDDVSVHVGLPGYPSVTGMQWVGDVIFYLDVLPPTEPGELATTAENRYQEGVGTGFVEWTDLLPGKHTFSVQLVTQAKTPLEPPVVAQLELILPELGSGNPAIQALSVQSLCSPRYQPATVPGQLETQGEPCADVNVSPEAFNFDVVNKVGQPAVPGEGHFIYYFDTVPPMIPGDSALTEDGTYVITTDSFVTWTDVVPGEYELWVQLVNNDNTVLEVPSMAKASIIVPSDVARYPGYLFR